MLQKRFNFSLFLMDKMLLVGKEVIIGMFLGLTLGLLLMFEICGMYVENRKISCFTIAPINESEAREYRDQIIFGSCRV